MNRRIRPERITVPKTALCSAYLWNDTNEPAQIESKMNLASEHGIDVFDLQVMDVAPQTLELLKLYLDTATETGMRCSFMIERFEGMSVADRVSMITTVIEDFEQHPALFKPYGLPFFNIYSVWNERLSEWDLNLTEAGVRATLMAETGGRNLLDYLSTFDGLYCYYTFPLSLKLDAEGTARLKTLNEFYDGECRQRGKLWIPTLMAHYDERNIPGRSGIVVESNSGLSLMHTYEAMLSIRQAQIVRIDTWDEGQRGQGEQSGFCLMPGYLDLLASIIKLWKATPERGWIS